MGLPEYHMHASRIISLHLFFPSFFFLAQFKTIYIKVVLLFKDVIRAWVVQSSIDQIKGHRVGVVPWNEAIYFGKFDVWGKNREGLGVKPRYEWLASWQTYIRFHEDLHGNMHHMGHQTQYQIMLIKQRQQHDYRYIYIDPDKTKTTRSIKLSGAGPIAVVERI